MKGKGFLLLAWLVLLGIGLVGAQKGLWELSPEVIRNFILSFGWVSPFLYIFLYTIRPLFLFPAVILSLTGGMTFGAWWGTLFDLIGASLGAYLAFGLSRKLGRASVQKWMGKRLQLWDGQLEENGFKAILIMRLIPLIPFDAVNYGAGLSKVRFRDYALATPLGIIPGAFAYNYLGHSLHEVFSPTFFAAVALVVLLTVLPMFWKKKKSHLDYRLETEEDA